MIRRNALTLVIIAAALAFVVWPGATRGAAEPSEERTVVAAMFFSNFCASCRVLDPRINAVLPEYADTPLDFVKLDQTLSMVRGGRIQALAEAHGIEDVYAELKGGTGFVALIDPRDQQVIEIVTVRYREDDIRDAFDRAIAVVAHREIS